jgi:hypothetical protein
MSNAPVAATADSDADTVRDRRSFRGRTHADPGRLVDIGLAALDHGDMPGAQARLEVVAEAVAVSIDAIGWWISECPVGASALTTRSFAMYRVTGVDVQPGPGGGLGRQFELADYPLSAAAVAGGGHVVEVDDAYADPAEVALLDGMSCVAVMLAGGWDTRSGSGWLVEVFADEISLPLRGMVGSLRALVAVALSGPS